MFKSKKHESDHRLFTSKDVIPSVMKFLQFVLGMEEKIYHLALQIQGVNNHLDLRKALRVEVCNMLILSSTSQLCQLDCVFQAIWGKYKLILDPCGRLTEVKCGCRVNDHNQEKISVYQF